MASIALAGTVFKRGYVNCWVDSHEFLDYANSFFHPAGRIAWYYRDPAYPFLIWLSGFPHTHNLHMLFFFQTVFAALVPILICLTVACVSPLAGLIAGWMSVISLIPFIFQLELFNDQVHLFLLVLCAFTAVRCLHTGNKGYLYGTMISFGFLFACRPTFFFLAPLPFFIAALWAKDKKHDADRGFFKHVTAAILILMALIGITFWLRASPYMYATPPKAAMGISKENVMIGPAIAPLQHYKDFTPVTNYSGEQLFSQLYLHGGRLKGTFSPQDGPYTKKFLEVMTLYIQNSFYINGTAIRFLSYAEPYLKPTTATVISPDQALQAYLHNPTSNVSTLPYFFDWYGDQANALVRHIYMEQITAHPKIILSMLKGGFSEVLLSTYAKYHYNDDYFGYSVEPAIFFEPFDREFGCKFIDVNEFIHWKQKGLKKFRSFNGTYTPYYICLTKIFNFMALAGLPLYLCWLFSPDATRRREAITYFIFFTLYWVPNFLMMFMVIIVFRYHATSALLSLMMAAMVLRHIVKFIGSKLPDTRDYYIHTLPLEPTDEMIQAATAALAASSSEDTRSRVKRALEAALSTLKH